MKMTSKTKLLEEVCLAIESTSSDDTYGAAQCAIDAMADWFEEALETIGMQPSVIPTLLRWQAHQHEYIDD